MKIKKKEKQPDTRLIATTKPECISKGSRGDIPRAFLPLGKLKGNQNEKVERARLDGMK